MIEPVIVGWAHTPFGRLEEPDVEHLLARVSASALDHAGVPPHAVDAIYTGVFNAGFARQGFGIRDNPRLAACAEIETATDRHDGYSSGIRVTALCSALS